MKNTWWNRYTVLDSTSDIEIKRQELVFYFSSYIGCFILAIFAYNANDSHNELLRFTLIITTILLFLNAIFAYLTKRIDISCAIGSIFLIVFMMMLFYGGGHKNTALYWLFPFPFVLFVLLGSKKAIIINSGLVITFAFFLYHDQFILAEYRPEEKNRFLASFTVTIILSLIAEIFRYRSHKELIIMSDKSKIEANTDPLTKLPNRRFINSVLLSDLRLNPEKYLPLTFAIADLDHFKKINDQYGHDVGDIALLTISNLLQKNMRKSDTIARMGGEEFLFLFPKTDLATGHFIVNNIRKKIEKTEIEYATDKFTLTSSFGVATTHTANDIDDGLKQADLAVYEARNSGRNTVR